MRRPESDLFPRVLPPTTEEAIAQRVLLGADFVALTAALPDLGRVLTTTCNAHAALAEYGGYPLLRLPADDRHVATAGAGGLFLDFTRWNRAYASQRPVPASADNRGGQSEALFSLEFSDREEEIFQRICLLPDSNLRGFHSLVRAFEKSASGADARPAAPDTGGEIRAFQRTRLSALRHRAAGTGKCGCGRHGCIDALRPLKFSPSRLAAVLRLAEAAGLPLRVSLFHEAAVHTAFLHQTDAPVTSDNGWLYAGGDQVGLHLHTAGVRSLWFTLPGRDDPAGEACLEAYDADGDLVLVLAAADPARDETLWRALVCCP